MKRILIIFFPILAFAGTPDFELLQGNKGATWKTLKKEDLEELRFYKEVFERNLSSTPVSSRIPEVIHFIWLGPRPFPDASIKNVESWKKHHSDWVFKFWTDDENRVCPVAGMEKHLIQELDLSYLGPFLSRTENLGEKSDMLRYEILLREGGVYVDHDVFCYRSFSVLNPLYDFYAGLDRSHPAEGQRTQIFAGNCLIGAIASHPLIRSILEKIADRWETVEKEFPTNEVSRVMYRTFLAFTEAVRENINDLSYKNILFPAFYFFPDFVYSKKIRKKLHLEDVSFASHSFSGLWTERPPTEITALKKKHREQMKKLQKRLNIVTYFTTASFLLISLLFVMHFKRRRS
jgi:mannosyltransferase OCH1-like enzyme